MERHEFQKNQVYLHRKNFIRAYGRNGLQLHSYNYTTTCLKNTEKNNEIYILQAFLCLGLRYIDYINGNRTSNFTLRA